MGGLLPGQSQLNSWSDWQRIPLWIEITLGTIPSWFPVFPVVVPGCSRNCSGESVLAGSREICLIWTEQQNAGLCRAEFLGQLFSDLVFNLLRNLRDVILSNFSVRDVFFDWLFLMSSCVSLETASYFRFFLGVAKLSE